MCSEPSGELSLPATTGGDSRGGGGGGSCESGDLGCVEVLVIESHSLASNLCGIVSC